MSALRPLPSAGRLSIKNPRLTAEIAENAEKRLYCALCDLRLLFSLRGVFHREPHLTAETAEIAENDFLCDLGGLHFRPPLRPSVPALRAPERGTPPLRVILRRTESPASRGSALRPDARCAG